MSGVSFDSIHFKNCNKKARYLTKEKALKHMKELKKRGRRKLKRAYKCRVCDNWHLTTKEKTKYIKKLGEEMLIKVYDHCFVAKEIQHFEWVEEVRGDDFSDGASSALVVRLKNRDKRIIIPGPKSIFGQFEKNYRTYMTTIAYRREQ